MKVRDAIAVARQVGKADDDTRVVNGRWSVPGHAAEVADVSRYSVLPDNCVCGAEAPYRAIADARDTHYSALIIDRRGCRAGIGINRRKLADRALAWAPDYRTKLQDLSRGHAGRIMKSILGPADGLATIIDSGGVTVEPA